MSNFSEKLPRSAFIVSIATVLLGGAFLYGALAYRNDLPPIPELRMVKAMLVDFDLTNSLRHQHLQHSRSRGQEVTINRMTEDGSFVLLAGFFDEENQARLIRRDGTVIKKWSLEYEMHFPDPDSRVCDLNSPLGTDVHGVHLTPLGELVFNYEYCGTVKLDQCQQAIWRISKPTHHSLIPAEDGGYWLLGRYKWMASEEPDRFPPFSAPATDTEILEDTLLRISEFGEILEEVSIPMLLRENNLLSLLTANGESFTLGPVLRAELVHANKVAELQTDIADSYPLFDAGDLVISMRGLNLLVVLDATTKRVKWHQTGPWIRQHDPEFRPDGRISIFNNNSYRTAYEDEKAVKSTPNTTNIIVVDPVSRETEVIFGDQSGQEMLSVIRGQHELLDHDGMLITEFDGGRVLEVNANREIIWEYVNRYDDEFVGEITNSAIYSSDYFKVELKACGR